MVNKFSENSFITDFPIISAHSNHISIKLWIFPLNRTTLFWNIYCHVSLLNLSFLLSLDKCGFKIRLPITPPRSVLLIHYKRNPYLKNVSRAHLHDIITSSNRAHLLVFINVMVELWKNKTRCFQKLYSKSFHMKYFYIQCYLSLLHYPFNVV